MRTRFFVRTLLLLYALALLLPVTAIAASKGEEEMQKGLRKYGEKEYATAADHFSKASALLEEEKKTIPAADAAYNEGLCLKGSPGVLAAFDRAAALYGRGGEETKAANALLQGAQTAFAEADLAGAERRYEEAHEKAAHLKSGLLEGLSLEGLGKTAFRRGRIAESGKFFADSLEKLEGVQSARVRVSLQLAAALRKYGDMPGALARLDAAEEELAPLESDEKTRDLAGLMRFMILAERGYTFLQLGIFDEAGDWLKSALDYDVDNPLISEANRLSVEGNMLVARGELGNPAFSAEALETLRQLVAGKGLKDEECAALISRGRLLRADGKYPEAMECFEEASSLALEAGLPGRRIQAAVARANLLYFQGSWKASENYYRLAFNGALEQGDMEVVLTALMGVERVARANHMGMSGKVDYRRMQGIPWRGALLQERGIIPARGGDALPMAWRRLGDLSREWFSTSVPGLHGAMAVMSASEMLSWRRLEGMARHLIAEGTLRLVAGRRETFQKVATALRSLDKERGEAADPESLNRAYQACWDALSNAAGRGLLGKKGAPIEIRIDGLLLVPDDKDDSKAAPAGGSDGTEEARRLLAVLIEAVNSLSLNEKEQRQTILALLRGEPLPGFLSQRLARAAVLRAAERSRSMEERLMAEGDKKESALNDYSAEILTLLDGLGSSPLDEIRGQEKLARYIKGIESESRQDRENRAYSLAGSTPPFAVYTLVEAAALSGVRSAWSGLSLRATLLRRLEIIGEPKEMNLRQGADLIAKGLSAGAEAFDRQFSLAGAKSAAEREMRISRLLSISEELARVELLEQHFGCVEVADSPEGAVAFDDRQAMRELIARYLITLGEPGQALEKADEVRRGFGYAARSVGGTPNPEVVWRTLSISAKASLALGRETEALSFLDQAIEVMESVTPSDGVNSQATADKLEVYRTGIETAFRLYELDGSKENAERLWRYLEGMKSRQWREMLATTGSAFLDRLPEREAEGYRSLSMRAAQLMASIAFQDLRGLAEEADESRSELQEVRRGLSKIAAGYTVDSAGGVPSLKEASDAIHGDWAVADYYLSSDLSFAFVLQKDRDAAVVRLPLDYESLFSYTLWMRTVPDLEFQPVRANETVMAAGATSPRLAEQLFSPVAELTGGKKKLLVVPHDILYTFPYETLSVKGEGGYRFLQDDGWTFAELPSAFLLTGERRVEGPTADRRLVIIADPEYYPAVRKRLGASKALELLLEEVNNPHLQQIREAFCKFMAPLMNARREGEFLAKIWEGFGEARLLTGADASEKRLYDPDVAAWDAGHVHIVCHGYDRNSIPDLQPGLALSPVADVENDSFAQMGELSALRWRSELVVLSACDTGLGDLYIGDGMVGLNTVFLAGGVKGMLISRWRVPDDSAPDFMGMTYERIVGGASPVDAITAAKAELKKTYEEASDWAVFKYVGIPW